jgi:ribonuclease-3
VLGQILPDLAEELRVTALTHAVWAPSRVQSYERLEFLGDAVLGSVVAEELVRRFPAADEGELTRRKISVISRVACAAVARREGLDVLFVAAAPQRSVGLELSARPSVLAALTESAIGAVFTERGYQAAADATVAAFGPELEAVSSPDKDPKTRLQELVQADGRVASYALDEAAGPAHDRRFRSTALVDGVAVGHGSGRSLKASEFAAAVDALRTLQASG